MINSLAQIASVMTYLDRIGGEVRSLRTAVVKKAYGDYWQDLAIIRFTKEGKVECADESYLPTADEQAAIIEELKGKEWPEQKKLKEIINPHSMMNVEPEREFIFRDIDGNIVMVQIRFDRDGDKKYVPFTYWSDDVWRPIEPEGPLPLYNAHLLKNAATVFIHEGAKAARAVQEMVEAGTFEAKAKLAAHPWAQELRSAVHLGWIGGALSPTRTDWEKIMAVGCTRAYIVADNDKPGLNAVPKISKMLRIPTYMIQFTDEFPASFDLADEFPQRMFGKVDDVRVYIGPSFRECLHPATWATDLVQLGKGRPTPVLRDSFKAMWAYVEESDFFVCREMPEIKRGESILNKMLAPFSDAAETSRLIVKAYQGRNVRVCYRPDDKGLVVTSRGSSAINLHVPSAIKSVPGDVRPWEEFLEYMFVNPGERHEVKRWVATLIARPQVKMGYGLLLISEKQGIGKSTLGSNVLAPLVGLHNTGFPGESDVTSDYTHWVALKRLAIINEIYSGSSWKVYHKLKSLITDRDVSVNIKYERQYDVENWCHILACSNSMRALKVEQDDRRWFYPECSEVPWSADKFTRLRHWLDTGGLNIIKHWAEQFGDYVHPSDRAPMTDRKKEMIEGSRSEAQREAAALAEAASEMSEPVALAIKQVVDWCREKSQGHVHDSDYELRKAMVECGLIVGAKRIKVNNRPDYVLMNAALRTTLQQASPDDHNAIIRGKIKRPVEIMGDQF